jgi:hypothetical protein
LTDVEYPDNPDIEIRSRLDGRFSHSRIILERNETSGLFDITVAPANAESDTLTLANVDLLEFMPTIPPHVQGDDYLALVSVFEAEYSRQQVKFSAGEFRFSGSTLESDAVVRVDLARNCLQAYLWELIFVTEEDERLRPAYHGWFDFPRDLYHRLFEERNGRSFDEFAFALEQWTDVESRVLDLEVLRRVEQDVDVRFVSLNNGLYPMEGERFKKRKNILYPVAPNRISDFLTDETRFASFSPPGVYRKSEPKTTFLSHFGELIHAAARRVRTNNPGGSAGLEIELVFERQSDGSRLRLITGGLDPGRIPVLPLDENFRGFQMPLGVGNHSFYEPYPFALSHSSTESAFYSVLLDEDGRWLDGSVVGIDGTLLHFDSENGARLHFWILSFERHCFVGHFVLDLNMLQLGLFEERERLARPSSPVSRLPVNLTEFE